MDQIVEQILNKYWLLEKVSHDYWACSEQFANDFKMIVEQLSKEYWALV